MLDWLLEGLGWASLNTGLHGSMAVMIDLRGSSANTENLLRIRSGPANRLKETVQPRGERIPAHSLNPLMIAIDFSFESDVEFVFAVSMWTSLWYISLHWVETTSPAKGFGLFIYFLEDISPFCGATDTRALCFWWRQPNRSDPRTCWNSTPCDWARWQGILDLPWLSQTVDPAIC